jgi:elongation factor G
VSVGDLRIAYRETITKTAEYDYTHKKQAGGAGEFARVKIRFEPLPRGSGFAFVNAVSDGRVPSDYATAVGEALREAARRGGVRCYPTVDFMATLIDGAYHDTDSNAQTFTTAGGACFRKAMAKAGPQLLEPVMKVTVLTPDEYMGDVIGDLNRRRGAISRDMSQQGTMRAIDALVPLRHMIGYDSHLRGMTQRRGSWTTQFDHYAPCWRGDDLDPVHPGAAMGLR